jgi:hypothetical protein
MAANVTISHLAFADRRISYLGELAGYSHMEALGRLACLWSRCTELQTDTPGALELKAALGPRGEQALIESGLGQRLPTGEIRVRGCDGRIEWFEAQAGKRAAGGRARAAGAKRDQRGRLLASSVTSELDNAGRLLDPAIQQPNIAGPATSSATSRSDSDSDPNSGERERDPAPPPPKPPGTPEPRLSRASVTTPDPEIKARRHLVAWGLDELNRIRARVAERFGWTDVRPLPTQGRIETDLLDRLRSAGDQADGHLRHVLRIAELEAVDKQTVEYLGGGIFSDAAWSKKVAMRASDVKRARPAGDAPARSLKVRRDDDDMPPLGGGS